MARPRGRRGRAAACGAAHCGQGRLQPGHQRRPRPRRSRHRAVERAAQQAGGAGARGDRGQQRRHCRGHEALGLGGAPQSHQRAAGRRRRGPDGAGADVRDQAAPVGAGQRAGAAHPRRFGRPRALPQRPLDPAHAAGAPRAAGDQRERHRGHRRDQVRRQRHPWARWWPTWSRPICSSS